MDRNIGAPRPRVMEPDASASLREMTQRLLHRGDILRVQVHVQPGDTLHGILRRLGVAENRLANGASVVASTNHLANPNFIRAGSVLTIPDTFVRDNQATPRPATPTHTPTHTPAPSPAHSPAAGTTSPVAARTARISRHEELASTDPTGPALAIPAELADVIRTPDDALNLDALERSFNPLNETTGPLTRAGDLFRGKTILPIQDLVGQALLAVPEPNRAAIAPLLPKLSRKVVLFGPAQQYFLPETGKPGNRIVFYGGSVHHQNIDEVVKSLGKQDLRLMKQMVHFNHEAQGGSIEDIVGDGVGGATHVGGFSAGMLDGHASTIKSDWPSSYGQLGDYNEKYNANLFAIDYQAGAKDPIPERNLKAYKQNADMWDCFAGMLVPFTDEDPDLRYRDYMFNPLEVHDQASVQQVAKDLASMDSTQFLEQHGTFYCAEGQYSVANLGPNALIKKSLYQDTQLGRLIDAFQSAPGLSKDHPEIGWKHLADNHLITTDQYQSLEETNRLATYLDWVPEDVEPWTAFRPNQKDGLIAQPMTVATMVWGLLRNYLPRDGIAQAIVEDLGRVYKEAVLGGDEATKNAVLALSGGQAPVTPEGARALIGFGMTIASNLLAAIAGKDEFRDRMLAQAGARFMTNDSEKAVLNQLYDAFVDTIRANATAPQEVLDTAIRELDQKLAELVVDQETFDATHPDNPGPSIRMGLMKYAAPQCVGFWAQHPDVFGDSNAIRYVATAMHARQAKPGLA